VVHPRPRLDLYQRVLICERVRQGGWRVSAAARAAGVSRQTAHKWLRRFEAGGLEGLQSRSSRPHRTPRLTRIDRAVAICHERVARHWGPHQLSYLLGIPRSTVYAVLRRAELSRLRSLRRRDPVRRYEWPAPGDLVHLDTKKLGRIVEGGGWRNLGRQRWNAKAGTGIRRRVGYELLHVAVDDHSRLPSVVIAQDERPQTAVRALEALWSTYLRSGVRIKRVLTDNGNCYCSRDFREACSRLGIRHLRTRPYTPRTNGKVERFIRTLQDGWAYAQLYGSSRERAAALPAFLDHWRHRPSTVLQGHTPACRFTAVNDLSGSNI